MAGLSYSLARRESRRVAPGRVVAYGNRRPWASRRKVDTAGGGRRRVKSHLQSVSIPRAEPLLAGADVRSEHGG